MSSAASSLEQLCSAFLAAQLAGNRREAVRLLTEDGLPHHSVAELQHDVVEASQREIGRLWQANRVSVAQEHLATAVAQVALAQLFQRAAPARRLGKRVLLACVEGELHDFPARCAADALEHAGFDVAFLGANVPLSGLLAFIDVERPDLVALSVTMAFNVPALERTVAALKQAAPERPVLVGGHALTWDPQLPSRLGVAGGGDDGRALVRAARRTLGLAEDGQDA